LHILKSIDNVSYTEVTMKRADQVKNMSHWHNAVSVEKKSLNIDSSVFNRLLLICWKVQWCWTVFYVRTQSYTRRLLLCLRTVSCVKLISPSSCMTCDRDWDKFPTRKRNSFCDRWRNFTACNEVAARCDICWCSTAVP